MVKLSGENSNRKISNDATATVRRNKRAIFDKSLERMNLIKNQMSSQSNTNDDIKHNPNDMNNYAEVLEYIPKDNKENRIAISSAKTNLNKTFSVGDNIVSPTFDNTRWAGFHRKNIVERQRYIQKIHPEIDISLLKNGGLSLLRADSIIENCIGILSLPVGLATNFVINSKKYSVPMAVEEPSVIAGVSTTAKLIGENNGFFAYCDPSFMIGQIHIADLENEEEAIKKINLNKEILIKKANDHCQHMVQRGGGVQEIFCRKLVNEHPNTNFSNHCTIKTNFICLDLIVDVVDSMGANTINTVTEGLSGFLEDFLNCRGKIILKILSNLSIYRKATAEFKISLKNLTYKHISGEKLAEKIIKAYEISYLDPFRASTHNKGIMNGIDAVAIALGQDWRAIEAGAHTYAAINPKNFDYDRYKPLTYYKIIEVKNEKFLFGSLTMPIAIGTVGGSINSNPIYENMFKLIGNPNAQQLSNILVSVGLAQNFAALRALVSEGIQKGHMGLQGRNVAIRAGVPDFLVADVSNFMKNNNSINEVTAKKYLESLNLLKEIRNKNNVNEPIENLSSVYIELDYPFLKVPIIMNVLLNANIDPPIHFSLRSKKMLNQDNRVNDIYKDLFGASKNGDWLHEFIKFITNFDLSTGHISSSGLSELISTKYKIKMALILFFTVSYNLLKIKFEKSKLFLEKLLTRNYNYSEIVALSDDENVTVSFGLSLLFECYEIFCFYFENYLNAENRELIKDKLYREIEVSIQNYINMYDTLKHLSDLSKNNKLQSFEEFFEQRKKRINIAILILIDLGFSEEKASQELVDAVAALGRYVEIKITLLRDFTRYKFDKGDTFNSFRIFKMLFETEEQSRNNNSNTESLESSVVKDYFMFKLKEREDLFKKTETILQKNSDLSRNIKDLETTIEKYYKQYENKNITSSAKF